MSQSVTVRFPDETVRKLRALSRQEGTPVSDLVRCSVEKYLCVHSFRKLRAKVLPFAEAQGLLTDEDIFKALQ